MQAALDEVRNKGAEETSKVEKASETRQQAVDELKEVLDMKADQAQSNQDAHRQAILDKLHAEVILPIILHHSCTSLKRKKRFYQKANACFGSFLLGSSSCGSSGPSSEGIPQACPRHGPASTGKGRKTACDFGRDGQQSEGTCKSVLFYTAACPIRVFFSHFVERSCPGRPWRNHCPSEAGTSGRRQRGGFAQKVNQWSKTIKGSSLNIIYALCVWFFL